MNRIYDEFPNVQIQVLYHVNTTTQHVVINEFAFNSHAYLVYELCRC